MLSAKHEDAAYGLIRENVVGRTESIRHRDYKLAANGARLATGAVQKRIAQRVHNGKLHGGYHNAGFYKTR